MKILVTGATGFIGSALIEYLVNIQGCAVVGIVIPPFITSGTHPLF
jgi:nucleoside-diphosphate-sugar epimerase